MMEGEVRLIFGPFHSFILKKSKCICFVFCSVLFCFALLLCMFFNFSFSLPFLSFVDLASLFFPPLPPSPPLLLRETDLCDEPGKSRVRGQHSLSLTLSLFLSHTHTNTHTDLPYLLILIEIISEINLFKMYWHI